MPIIKTREDWIDVFHSNVKDIYNILGMYLDMKELATDTPGDLDSNVRMYKGNPITVGQDIDNAIWDRDYWRLLRYMNGAWFKAPDKPHIHSIPGWGTMCDLCSEEWVFGDTYEN